MESRPSTRPAAREIVNLARRDKRAAEAQLARLSPDEQLAVVCEAPHAQRCRILELVPEPADLIPRIPEAELCFTVKAIGLEDGGWLLEYATPEQLISCADLDTWKGLVPDHASFDRWLAVFAEAGEETLLTCAQSLDTEHWVLYLRQRIYVWLKPNDDESWQPPEGSQTIDGQFYFAAIGSADDAAALQQMLRVLFQKDYWLYFRVLQGVIWELDSDLEEWALRWRTGRLEDLGFPSWDEAMRIYAFIRPDQRFTLAEEADALDVSQWRLPIWMPELPVPADTLHSIFRTASELDTSERHAFFFAFVALANKVAVADELPLGDAETLPLAIEKVAGLTSGGLDAIAEDRGLARTEIVRRTALERLFQVGANLDPENASSARGRSATRYMEDPETDGD